MNVQIKGVYEFIERSRGARVLVDDRTGEDTVAAMKCNSYDLI